MIPKSAIDGKFGLPSKEAKTEAFNQKVRAELDKTKTPTPGNPDEQAGRTAANDALKHALGEK